MTILRYVLFLSVIFIGLRTAALRPVAKPSAGEQNQSAALLAREDAYRANNVGVALLEQFKYKDAVEAFKRALQIDPKLTLARINLSIALFNLPDLPGAQREAQSVIGITPDFPQPHYILGLIAKSQSRGEDAIAAFQRVLKFDPNDTGTNINLGQLYAQQRKYPEAIATFRTALAAEPYNGTALYNLGQVLLRSQQREEGLRVIQRFQELRERGSGTTIGQNYLEQGRYAEAIASTGAEPELIDRAAPGVTFADSSATMLPKQPSSTGAGETVLGRSFKDFSSETRREISSDLGGSVLLFDYDGDGRFDLFAITATGQHLYHGEGGKFTDVTDKAGALNAKLGGTGAVAGDYDNDSKPDLFVIRDGSLSLFHNDGNGSFSDRTSAAGIPAYPYLSVSAAFVDVDHDGDLDIFIAGLADLSKAPTKVSVIFPDDFATAPNLLLRNDGTGKFTDVSSTAKVVGAGHAVAIVPTDFNNRRDVDLLVVNYGAAPNLFSNQRDGTFRDVASQVGLAGMGRTTCVAAGDVNKDGYTDFFFGRADGTGQFAISDGKEKFKTLSALAVTEETRAAQFLDYDNDGLLDCVMLTNRGLRVWRNVGEAWVDVSERAVVRETREVFPPTSGRFIAAGDLDHDGDVDLIIGSPAGTLRIARNEGGNDNRSLSVKLTGKISNRSGAGAKIDVRAGSLTQKLEVYCATPAPAPADIIFGLGKRQTADAVRVLWPAGIVQAETEIPRPDEAKKDVAATLIVVELDRKPSSCPFLFAWNGERFEFVTDFMGGGEMGYLEEPGRYNKPDPDEYVRLRSDQLRERNGKFEIRVTNELEEALFVDRLQLLSIEHPADTEVYPNEGMTDPPKPFRLYLTQGVRPPLSAIDDHGHDVLARISYLDRSYPDDFQLERIRGYAQEHYLSMNLGDTKSKVQSPKSGQTKSKVQSPKSKVKRTGFHFRGQGSTKAHLRHPTEARQTLDVGHWTLDKKRTLDKEKTVLLMTGWTDYAWSSDNVAASQAGQTMKLPALQVKDKKGNWRTIIEDIGIPVGRPQTVVVDLTGKFLSANREVRIVTNMRIYWDQILVDTSAGSSMPRITKLEPVKAELRWRGFSREVTPDGREPFGYDYEHVSFASPWKVMTGYYTREGDVRELLSASDDMFIISRPGDEISVSFDARALPRLAAGWKRTFLLYADGFSKEMDINSASPEQVGPLPFHGMTRYPYDRPESYPLTEERRAYLEKYNTRLVKSPVPAIETTLVQR